MYNVGSSLKLEKRDRKEKIMNDKKKEKERFKELETFIALLLIIGAIMFFTVLAFAAMFLRDTAGLFQP